MSDIKTISYQEKVVCNSCKGENEILQSVVSGGLVYECETRCKVCGFEDYWSHGFFQQLCWWFR